MKATPIESLKNRLEALRFHGLLAHWSEVATTDWLVPLVQWEEGERARAPQPGATPAASAYRAFQIDLRL